MTPDRLNELLSRVGQVGVAVIGDFCLDAYWELDDEASEVSVETGKPAHAVRDQRYGLGGAGNVVQNLVDLGVPNVHAIGVVGDDLFGRELRRRMEKAGVEVSGLVVQPADWQTPVYAKPLRGDDEQSRFDWGAFNCVSGQTETALVAGLHAALVSAGTVIINQQLPKGGPYRGKLIARINEQIAKHSKTAFLVDSRDMSERFRGATLKINDVEAVRLARTESSDGASREQGDTRRDAQIVHERTGQPVFVTCGDKGIVLCDDAGCVDVPGVEVLGETDPVGAGDTCIAAIAAALAAGATRTEAAELGNFAAAVTVRKLRQTGSATPAEIRAVGADPNYVYRPDLAADRRDARYLNDTEIELVSESIPLGRIEHVVFDHDGTISTVREGWEQVMAPVCVRAILGDVFHTVSRSEYQRVADRVATFIDQTTGVQTIVQMEMLVEMVQQAGYVDPARVLDRFEYKRIYNDALMQTVNARLAKLERGELTVDDYTIKGAVSFLRQLRDRGVTLYLASGTDREDVVREAEVLGYADLFAGGIHGAVGDITKYSKKRVIDEILTRHGLEGPQLACFGDGPVEIRETQKRGGITVGICSDEVRRYGYNAGKRSRLIRAGADAVVPDFSQANKLLEWLFPH